MTTTIDARIAELELKLVDTEDAVDALNLTVFRQQRLIEQLQRELKALREQWQTMPAGEPRSLRDEIPPHY